MSGGKKAKGEGRKAHFPFDFPGSMGRNGFTLIEVLIAMTLLSLMVTLLFGSLRICSQSWEQGENKMAEVNEAAVVYNFFQRYLSSAMPLSNEAVATDTANRTGTGAAMNGPGKSGTTGAVADRGANQGGPGTTEENSNRKFSFQGDRKSLQFVSTFPASAGRSGMQMFFIYQGQQDGEPVLKVALTPFLPVAEGGVPQREEEILLRHVSNFELAYFGIIEETGESRWQDQWLERNVLPRLVRVRIGTANGAFWPDMIIDLKSAGPGISLFAAEERG